MGNRCIILEKVARVPWIYPVKVIWIILVKPSVQAITAIGDNNRACWIVRVRDNIPSPGLISRALGVSGIRSRMS